MKNKILIVSGDKEKEVKKIKGLVIHFSGTGHTIKIEKPYYFKDSSITIDGHNNSVYIGSSKIGFNQLEILIAQNGCNKELRFGKDCSCISLVIFQHENNSKVLIGNNCMFARNTCIQATDSHSIIDCSTNKPINFGKEVVLGNNVWVAQDVTILKNVHIPDNVVVQTKALVVKDVPESNCVVGGIPAKIIKSNVRWTRWAPNHLPYNNMDSDITFVVQGAVDPFWTRKCLQSIRNYFPASRILLSTWEGTDLKGIQGLYDEVLLNKDPGAIPFSQDEKHPTTFNLDRQIVSSKNGLKAVKTKYAMKIRTDMIIKNKDFLKYFDKFSDFDNKYRLVEKRIVSFAAYSPYTSEGKRSWDFCMHDYAYFGLTKDLLLVWDIPTMTEKEKHYWKGKNYPTLPENVADFMKFFLTWHLNYQYHAEQYIHLKMFSKLKNIHIHFENMFDVRPENIELFKKLFVNNFVPLYSDRMGISLPKNSFPYDNPTYSSNLDYTWCEFLKLYNEYAGGHEEIPNQDEERQEWLKPKIKRKSKVRRMVLHIIACFVPLKKWRRKIRSL